LEAFGISGRAPDLHCPKVRRADRNQHDQWVLNQEIADWRVTHGGTQVAESLARERTEYCKKRQTYQELQIQKANEGSRRPGLSWSPLASPQPPTPHEGYREDSSSEHEPADNVVEA
jgi:hypothetical protein